MTRLLDTNLSDWCPVRPELTNGVSGFALLDGTTKMVLTEVVPEGSFRPHRDRYGHLFHVISGEGHFTVEGMEYPLSAGMALRVQAGELHGYKNIGTEKLLLLSVNIPE